jgi:hypothetical protein
MTYLILIAVILVMISIGLIYREDTIFLFKPSYWIMIYPYNKEVDTLLNKLLDNFEFSKITEFNANLGETELWIENHPYASFRIMHPDISNFRASRKTILRAKKALDKQYIVQAKIQDSSITDAINEVVKSWSEKK